MFSWQHWAAYFFLGERLPVSRSGFDWSNEERPRLIYVRNGSCELSSKRSTSLVLNCRWLILQLDFLWNGALYSTSSLVLFDSTYDRTFLLYQTLPYNVSVLLDRKRSSDLPCFCCIREQQQAYVSVHDIRRKWTVWIVELWKVERTATSYLSIHFVAIMSLVKRAAIWPRASFCFRWTGIIICLLLSRTVPPASGGVVLVYSGANKSDRVLYKRSRATDLEIKTQGVFSSKHPLKIIADLFQLSFVQLDSVWYQSSRSSSSFSSII